MRNTVKAMKGVILQRHIINLRSLRSESCQSSSPHQPFDYTIDREDNLVKRAMQYTIPDWKGRSSLSLLEGEEVSFSC